MSNSAQLADRIIEQFNLGCPAATTLVRSVEPTAKRSKFAPKPEQIDEGLRHLCNTRKPGQVFTHKEIGEACGTSHRAIQFIEKRALYKFSRRLLAIAPEVFQESLGDGVSAADVLRIHHPQSSDSGRSKRWLPGEATPRIRAFRTVQKKTGQLDPSFRGRGLIALHKIEQELKKSEPKRVYGRRPNKEELAEIRRLRRENNLASIAQLPPAA